jgi:hypothetical protein
MLRSFSVSAVLGASLLLATLDAFACPQFLGHPYVPRSAVGDTASHASCNYNTIQDAIDGAVGDPACPDRIYITGDHLYTSGFCDPSHIGSCQLSIAGKSVELIGAKDDSCADVPANACEIVHNCPAEPTGIVALNGEDSTRVLTVTGTSNVTLRNVTITHGYSSGDGGGISFDGAGSLALYNSYVDFSTASSGGGINVNGSGAGATLTLGSNVQILGNTANGSGGGVRITGATYMLAVAPQIGLYDNHALTAYGGGLQIVGPAQADIGSSGLGGGVVFLNDAAYGGGIAVNTIDDSHRSVLRLFTTDPAKPVRISNNSASHTGGGIFLKPLVSSTAYTPSFLCAWDFRIDNNVAQEGSAIYSDEDHSTLNGDTEGGTVLLNGAGCTDPEPISALGAVPCTPSLNCNVIDDNVAADIDANPTDGSAILMQSRSTLSAPRLILRDNQGGHVIRTLETVAYLFDCLIVKNTVSSELILFENEGGNPETPGYEQIKNCTLSNNSVGGSHVIASAHELILSASIIYQAVVPTLSYSGTAGDLEVDHILSNDTSTLPATPDIIQGSPEYQDVAAGDYHLKSTSLGIDFAPSGDGVDLDGKQRAVDLPSIANFDGARDLGAYELQNLFYECGAGDSVFCDGFDH